MDKKLSDFFEELQYDLYQLEIYTSDGFASNMASSISKKIVKFCAKNYLEENNVELK